MKAFDVIEGEIRGREPSALFKGRGIQRPQDLSKPTVGIEVWWTRPFLLLPSSSSARAFEYFVLWSRIFRCGGDGFCDLSRSSGKIHHPHLTARFNWLRNYSMDMDGWSRSMRSWGLKGWTWTRVFKVNAHHIASLSVDDWWMSFMLGETLHLQHK